MNSSGKKITITGSSDSPAPRQAQHSATASNKSLRQIRPVQGRAVVRHRSRTTTNAVAPTAKPKPARAVRTIKNPKSTHAVHPIAPTPKPQAKRTATTTTRPVATPRVKPQPQTKSVASKPQAKPANTTMTRPMVAKRQSTAKTQNTKHVKPATKTPSAKALSQASNSTAQVASKSEPRQAKPKTKNPKKVKHIVVALVCAAACIAALACFVKLNIPTFSVHVAAMQAGIEASYPSYIPHDFTLSSVVSEGKQVVMTFKSGDGKEFKLTEEKSSWDSSALLNNFVKNEWGNDYSVAREQGITIYVSGSKATWVNGGLLYHIVADDDTLSKKQIYSIATSL